MSPHLLPTAEFAVYSLGGPGQVTAQACSPPFNPVHHSRYKYGSIAATDVFARALGEAFGHRYPEVVCTPRLLMTSSPYTYVPAAATTLARRLQPVLNAVRAGRGLAPVPLVQVDRGSPGAGDYGTLSPHDRDRRMAARTLSFRLDLPLAYVRAEARAVGGPLVECSPGPAARAVIIEDVAASGGSTVQVISALRAETGIGIAGVQSIANWNFPEMRARLTRWTVRAVTSYPQVIASARQAGLVSAADARQLLRFYADPRRHRWNLAGGAPPPV